jgi:sulfate permease, SulP family
MASSLRMKIRQVWPLGFTPKLVTVLSEGYAVAQFRSDLLAGLTVAVVALPLSMAIAIACGVSPDRGLITAIIGGFLVSLLGGSRFQIGGPAGAFIVLVGATVIRHGVDGLVLATLLSGIFLTVAGGLRLGTFVKYIPYPVTIGFTAGIGLIILASQITPFLGLSPPTAEPGPLLEKLTFLLPLIGGFNPVSAAVAFAVVLAIYALRRLRPDLPGMLIAISSAAFVTYLFDLKIATVASQFGELARGLPMPRLPDLSTEKVIAVLPDALGFTLLGAIESLLSAVVADSMTGRRHRSNMELVAQGIANIGVSFFGGFCVTGTIARTATNVRAGAHGPVAGMLHSVALLFVLMLLAPLAGAIPLAALAGVLVMIAWHMIDFRAIAGFLRSNRPEAAVLLTTLLLTVFRDLIEAIVIGVALGSFIFTRRMSQLTSVHHHDVEVPFGDGVITDPNTAVIRISGAFFFGSAPIADSVLDRIAAKPTRLVLDLSEVQLLDTTGANSLLNAIRQARKQGIAVRLCGLDAPQKAMLTNIGMTSDDANVASSLAVALQD